jgi:hypothetical protein
LKRAENPELDQGATPRLVRTGLTAR